MKTKIILSLILGAVLSATCLVGWSHKMSIGAAQIIVSLIYPAAFVLLTFAFNYKSK